MAAYRSEYEFGSGETAGAGSRTHVRYALGDYDNAVRMRLAAWAEEDVAGRIWQKDFTVWSPDHVPEITDRLGWLSLPETMRSETGDMIAFAAQVSSDGIKHAVLLGMGGSSLAPEFYQAIFGNRASYPGLIVLDSTHPDAVREVARRINLEHTLFIVASKSGTTIEPMSLFKYFYGLCGNTGDPAGGHFVAITDPGTPLDELAAERGFRRVFHATPDVGGRYSALSHFGLVPAALIGMDVAGYLESAAGMARRCRSAGAGEVNPGLLLGAILGELALAGRDNLTFVTSPSLTAFPDWLEQLIAESTGKDGKGIVPVAGEPTRRAEDYRNDRLFAYISLRSETCSETDALLRGLVAAGHPVIRFELEEIQDLAAEMFRWEMAVASAGAATGIHPFNQPDVQAAKSLAREAMEGGNRGSTADADTIPLEPERQLAGALSEFLGGLKSGDYIGLQAYIASSPEATAALQGVRASLGDRYGAATTLGFGPRYLHSTGQLHKGGPNRGVFIQIVDEPGEDLEVPETGFTFGNLISAQALGDYEALRRTNRRVLRINLGRDAAHGLERLRTAIRGKV